MYIYIRTYPYRHISYMCTHAYTYIYIYICHVMSHCVRAAPSTCQKTSAGSTENEPQHSPICSPPNQNQENRNGVCGTGPTTHTTARGQVVVLEHQRWRLH